MEDLGKMMSRRDAKEVEQFPGQGTPTPQAITAPAEAENLGRPNSTLALATTTSRAKVVLAYSACAMIWGTTWYAIRICISPGGYPTFAAAALRFTISSLALGVIWVAVRSKIKNPLPTEYKWISAAGAISGLAYGLLYSSEEQISGGLAAVISATSPLMTAILATVVKLEAPRKATFVGSTVALAGIALVYHDRMQVSAAQASAVGLLLINSFFNSSSNILMKRHGQNMAPLASNTIFFTAASVALWAAAAISDKRGLPNPLPQAPTFALLYLTLFGTLIAFFSFFYLLRHTRLSTAMTLAFVTPMIALIIDAFFEKSKMLTLELYFGIAVVLVGVIISVTSTKKNVD